MIINRKKNIVNKAVGFLNSNLVSKQFREGGHVDIIDNLSMTKSGNIQDNLTMKILYI